MIDRNKPGHIFYNIGYSSTISSLALYFWTALFSKATYSTCIQGSRLISSFSGNRISDLAWRTPDKAPLSLSGNSHLVLLASSPCSKWRLGNESRDTETHSGLLNICFKRVMDLVAVYSQRAYSHHRVLHIEHYSHHNWWCKLEFIVIDRTLYTHSHQYITTLLNKEGKTAVMDMMRNNCIKGRMRERMNRCLWWNTSLSISPNNSKLTRGAIPQHLTINMSLLLFSMTHLSQRTDVGQHCSYSVKTVLKKTKA